MNENVIEIKSFDYAVRIVNLYRYLTEEKKEFVLSKQLLKSGTSVGANVAEAQRGQTKPDFNAKMNIALKEANETYYWLRLLHKTEYITDREFLSIKEDSKEIIAILTSICKKTNSERL
ncbi:MAG: four helix bundle protein [Clostridia bacterium]|nr:four helix bundle protein [Clostridia bacterium]